LNQRSIDYQAFIKEKYIRKLSEEIK